MRTHSPEIHYDFEAGTERATGVLPPRVGIYSGSFDPVHAGHVAFALQAQKLAGLEHVFFMPERQPKGNHEAEHHTHRAVMVDQALRPYEQFSLLDLPDARLTLRSLPRLRRALPTGVELSLLLGADELLEHKPNDIPQLYQQLTLIIAITSNDQLAEVLARINASSGHFRNLLFIDIGKKRITSSTIRSALRHGQKVSGLLPSVWRYARHQWLYISLNHPKI